MTQYLFTSESVAIGHPDKVCDQIADAILDECLRQDPLSRVACEALISSGLLVLAGEITTKGTIDYQEIARETIRKVGYEDSHLGFDYQSCGVIVSLHTQSPDIAQGLEEGGAGDQGIMFGFACNETPELMPLPIMLAHRLTRALKHDREKGLLPFLRPDGKSQVTVAYDEAGKAARIDTVVLSAQHDDKIELEILQKELKSLIFRELPSTLIDKNTRFFINPTGRFVIGGPAADCGLTGRKTAVDTYGGRGHHGGGSFSGKDPTKVDRSGSYAARWVAKTIVAAGLAPVCEVQLSYAIGVNHPISIRVETFKTAHVDERRIEKAIPQVFDLSPNGIITSLNLRRPFYLNTAFGGHFGRTDFDCPWEKTDRVKALLTTINE